MVRISTRLGEVLLWLYDETPKHKASFLALIEEGYWDDYCFNRVVPNFVAQAGCPDTAEGFGYCVHLLEPEIRPGPAFRHTRGALGAGRDDNPEKLSAACQFYVCQAEEEITRTQLLSRPFARATVSLTGKDDMARTERGLHRVREGDQGNGRGRRDGGGGDGRE